MISVKLVSECLYTYVHQNEVWCTLCSVESSKVQEGICVEMHCQFTLKDLEANHAIYYYNMEVAMCEEIRQVAGIK